MGSKRTRVTVLVGLLVPLAMLSGPAHAATVNVSLRDNFADPAKAKAQQGDRVTWTNQGQNHHTVSSDMQLFQSPGFPSQGIGIAPGTTFSFDFGAAGKFNYKCEIHGFSAVIVVPLLASPASGTPSTVFTVTWASAMPSGYVEDIQISRPGGTVFKAWKTSQAGSSSTFVPDKGRGTYQFKSQLRNVNSGAVSAFSAPRSITVS